MQFILHISDSFKISILRISVASSIWSDIIQEFSLIWTMHTMQCLVVIDSEQLWEKMCLQLPEISQAWAQWEAVKSHSLHTIADIINLVTNPLKCIWWTRRTCLLPLCRHCLSSGSSCPAGGRACPRGQCGPQCVRGSGDHSPGSCSPSPPSPSSPRPSSPRWAQRTSSSRALRSSGEMELRSSAYPDMITKTFPDVMWKMSPIVINFLSKR